MASVDWNDILTAREASLELGKNPKYIYMLWKEESNSLLKGSVAMKGNTLLITREGLEYLRPNAKKEVDLAFNCGNCKVTNREVLQHFSCLSSHVNHYTHLNIMSIDQNLR